MMLASSSATTHLPGDRFTRAPEQFRSTNENPKESRLTDQYYNLQFKATSEYSVRTEGVPNYQVQVMTIYIRGVYLPGSS